MLARVPLGTGGLQEQVMALVSSSQRVRLTSYQRHQQGQEINQKTSISLPSFLNVDSFRLKREKADFASSSLRLSRKHSIPEYLICRVGAPPRESMGTMSTSHFLQGARFIQKLVLPPRLSPISMHTAMKH